MFSTDDFKPNSGLSTPKILTPGTHYCKIADIQTSVPPYDTNALTITFVLVGPDLPDFEGMAIDKSNPSLGNYKGQAAYVRAQKYSFSDYTPPRGKMIERDKQIFRYLTNMAYRLGIDVENLKVTGDTIEEFIENFKPVLMDAGYFYVTIAGKEETNDYGTNYRMYLPKVQKKEDGKGYLYPYYKDEPGLKDSALKDNMVIFDEKEHIDKEAPVEAEAKSTVMGGMGYSTTTGVSTTGITISSSTGKSPFDF